MIMMHARVVGVFERASKIIEVRHVDKRIGHAECGMRHGSTPIPAAQAKTGTATCHAISYVSGHRGTASGQLKVGHAECGGTSTARAPRLNTDFRRARRNSNLKLSLAVSQLSPIQELFEAAYAPIAA